MPVLGSVPPPASLAGALNLLGARVGVLGTSVELLDPALDERREARAHAAAAVEAPDRGVQALNLKKAA